ncbi:PREDICTED: acylphosphatase-1-like [Priapulus caudatus]|uniref:Acylphosphatase n=1 Tax=Priapulus caudatus TaxID=37621 RepID=A0ABM1EN44_PRICU|nr:PREDICTED: acylphosphatase-1-like [Priapulus caudatus]
MAAAGKLYSVNFEVFGTVQGVFFRKYTRTKASELRLVGWCRNTSKGTVAGIAQGPKAKLDVLKDWLRYKGSPHSRITSAVFSNEREIETLEFVAFTVKH